MNENASAVMTSQTGGIFSEKYGRNSRPPCAAADTPVGSQPGKTCEESP